MNNAQSCNYWVWFPGDFEIRHGLLQNFTREERGFDWPSYWAVDDCNKNVYFTKEYTLHQNEEFIAIASGTGYVEVNGKKFKLGAPINCEKGKVIIKVFVGNANGLPCAYISGKTIKSDPTWLASDFCTTSLVGTDRLYTNCENAPNKVWYSKEIRKPVNVRNQDGGVLYDFGRVVNGSIQLTNFSYTNTPITLCYGESETEALDVMQCYYKQENVMYDTPIRKRAFRYVYIPEFNDSTLELVAYHEYIPKKRVAELNSDDALLNKIWKVSEETFRLCSDLFFIDGVKRDRWIWSGDAYQSYLINQYSFFDEDINKRTILALRGRDNIRHHINTIVDYSILWVISIEKHYMMTGDLDFIKLVYPKIKIMMDYLLDQTNELGFIYGREGDWIFIDWAEIDKDGTVCAEQLLLLKAYQTMIALGGILEKDMSRYESEAIRLNQNIEIYFWDESLGAYIDCYESGKRQVSRHANIFAVIFDLADNERYRKILENVLLNDKIPAIVTPYFKFFESDAMCKLGMIESEITNIKKYWGGMLELGAATFWEEFDPSKSGSDHYSMYCDPYGKSLCHAWGASPIYLIGRYCFGVKPVTAGFNEFIVEPYLGCFKSLDSQIPIKDGEITFTLENGVLTVTSSRDGGTLRVNNKSYILKSKSPVSVLLP